MMATVIPDPLRIACTECHRDMSVEFQTFERWADTVIVAAECKCGRVLGEVDGGTNLSGCPCVGKDRAIAIDISKIQKIEQLNEDLAAGRLFISAQDSARPAPHVKDVTYAPIDPLDVKHGGVALRDLLKIDEERRREGHPNYRTAWSRLSDAQRAAVSAHWSAELRAKVAAVRERDVNQVRIDQEVD